MAVERDTSLRTVGHMASALGAPLHRVEYVLRTRQHIRPRARAGRIRLYDLRALAQVRHELNAIDARHAACAGPDREGDHQ
jgi:hypothetical protein